MSLMQDYLKNAVAALERVADAQAELEAASRLLADTIEAGGLVHIFGTDPHAAAIQDEFFFKPGGLVAVSPLYDPAFSLSHGAYRSAMCQSLDQLTPAILDYYEYMKPGEPILLLTLSPKSLVFAQALEKAAALGLKTIVLASPEDEENRKQLSAADCLIDARCPAGAHCLEVKSVTAGSPAGCALSACLTCLSLLTAQRLGEEQLWRGHGLVGADQAPVIKEYIERIRHL